MSGVRRDAAHPGPAHGVAIRVIGRSGAGKTTMIERLLSALAAEGTRVAAIKRARHHDAPADGAGTDTSRLLEAGGVAVAGEFAGEVVVRLPASEGFVTTLAGLQAIAEVVFVEGGHDLPLPAIALGRPEAERRVAPGPVLARVDQHPAPGEVDRDDIDTLVARVRAHIAALRSDPGLQPAAGLQPAVVTTRS